MARVLVIRTSSFGDVAMLVPVVYSVAMKYPQDRFSVLTRKSFAPLFENLAFNVNVVAFDPKKKHKGIAGLLKLSTKLTTSGFSHVADTHDVLRSKIIRTSMRLSGCRVAKLDKGRKDKKKVVDSKIVEPPLKRTTERYMDVFAKLGFPAPMQFTNILEFVPRDIEKLHPLVKEKTNQWVGIAPFAKHKGKIFPHEKMGKVIETLSKDKGITIFLFGAGPEETAVIDAWANEYDNIINTAGKLGLDRELILMSHLDVMLSMDSANMHLASLVQTPVVSIWGATHPNLGFYGYGQDIDNAIQIDNLECRPCSVYGDLPCARGDHACMIWIKEEDVIKKIYKVLGKDKL